MKQVGVVVVNADQEQCQAVCALLRKFDYQAIPWDSLSDLEGLLSQKPCEVVVVDLDTMAPEPQFFRNLKRRHREIYILALSQRHHHAGLEEAMSSHIFACLRKPLDPEELLFWLKSIGENIGVNNVDYEAGLRDSD